MKKWPTKPLLELATLIRGTEPGSESYVPSNQGKRFLRVGDITGKTDNPVYTRATKLIHVSKNDLLLALDGTPGYVSTGHDGAISSGIRKVEVSDKSILTVGWLRYALNSPDVQATIKQHTRGVTILHASSAVPYINIPLPPLAEQQRIVKLLDEADELRKLRADTDRKTTNLISALYHEVFGDPDTKDNRWPIVSLKDMGKVTTGNTPSRKDPEHFGSFIEWIKTDNIDATTGLITTASERLSEKGAMVGRVVPSGTILIICIAGSRDYLGDAAVVDRQVAINQQINAITPNHDMDSHFLCETIVAMKKVIQHRATGVMTGIINKSTLESIPMICPPLALQKEFGQRVTEIRELEASQATSRTRLDALFQSMLHRAFNGEL